MRGVSPPDPNGFPRGERELIHLAKMLRGTDREFDAVVRGTSMGETIPTSARVRIRCQPHERIQIGSVVSFIGGQTLITHRLVHRGERGSAQGYFVTHGDGVWLCDPPCEVERLVGVAQRWQLPSEGTWHDVGAESRRMGLRGAASRFIRRAICSALEVNVWLARLIFTSVYLPGRLLGFNRGAR